MWIPSRYEWTSYGWGEYHLKPYRRVQKEIWGGSGSVDFKDDALALTYYVGTDRYSNVYYTNRYIDLDSSVQKIFELDFYF